jgi:hypothetical protein
VIRWGHTLSKLFGLASTSAVAGPAHGASAPSAAKPGVVPNEGLGLAPHVAGKPGARAQALLAADVDGFHTLKVVGQPTRVTPTRATFRLGGPDGLRLRPGEQVLLELPEAFRGRAVYQAVLEHRQVQAEKSSVPRLVDGKKWDDTPGVTASTRPATPWVRSTPVAVLMSSALAV